jgi:tRNA threonylcarbamoyladenosine biosynthesis protein TsaB
MLILGVDTSGKNGSIALVQCEPGKHLTLDIIPLDGGTFSAQLVPQISQLLQSHKFTKNEIDAFAVVSGPGSFTGLRVGLAAIKALAEILRKPIAAVSLLEAVAIAGGMQGRVLAALDAGRGGIYCGEYAVTTIGTKLVSQQLLNTEEFLVLASGAQVVTPDARIAELSRERELSVTQIDLPKADAIGRIGFEKIEAREFVSPETLDANYIRRNDAEVKKPSGAYQP